MIYILPFEDTYWSVLCSDVNMIDGDFSDTHNLCESNVFPIDNWLRDLSLLKLLLAVQIKDLIHFSLSLIIT